MRGWELPRVNDERGSMTYMEAGTHIPQDVRGMEMVIFDGPGSRFTLKQSSHVICLSGNVVIQSQDGATVLDRPDVGVVIREGCEITSHFGSAVCLVFHSRL